MKRIAVIGHFGGEKELFDGQTVKTKILWEALGKTNEYEMNKVDTFGWRKQPLKLLKSCINAVKQSETVLMLPDYNGFLTFSVLLPLINFNQKTKLVYVVVGGWLPGYLKDHPFYLGRAKRFGAIVVETDAVKKVLENLGLDNVFVVPNFKQLNFAEHVAVQFEAPYSFCFFSRIIPEKGIEEAAEAINSINRKFDKPQCKLDVFGPIGDDYKDSFQKLLLISEDCIKYKGIVPFEKSVEILKSYYALLFPTLFSTECLPGTVIDAYASAIPVIAFNWNSAAEVIIHGKTGWICAENTVADLIKMMEYAIANEEIIREMKQNCLKEAEKYTPERCLPGLMKII